MPPPASKFKKDYYGGALLVVIGLAAVYAGIGYRVGELAHMGPGFFPVALGGLLALTGLLIALAARGEKPASEEAVSHGHPGGCPTCAAASASSSASSPSCCSANTAACCRRPSPSCSSRRSATATTR